jgi:hypothetical protein
VIAIRASDNPATSQEYQVKAAFLYNFIQFVDWPEEKFADKDGSITICIIGDDPFGTAFEPIINKQVKGKSVVIERLESFEKLKNSAGNDKSELGHGFEALKKCHLLFICSSEQKNLKEIIDVVKDQPILTVGEMEGFLEAGGIINWFVEEKKIRFEINVAAAKQAGLEIRSNLLRLAKRIVGENAAKKT